MGRAFLISARQGLEGLIQSKQFIFFGAKSRQE